MNLKESIDIKIIYWDDEPTEYLDDVTHNDIVDIQNDPNVYKIVDVTNGKKKTIYLAESKKSTRKSIKESKSLTDLCNSWVIGDVIGKFKNRDYCHKGNDYSVFNIGNIIEDALRDNYILEFDGDNKAKSVIFYMIDKDGKNVGSLEIYPDERYEISNYEDGYDLNELNMDEIADLFYEFQKNKIEYLLSDKRFDFTDKFWYNESKKSTRKSMKESKVDFQSVIDKVIPKEYAHNKNAYKYALHCVESLYNEDEYDSDNAKVYFLNCYISDLFPSWVDDLGEEEMDALANSLYDGLFKWSDIDSSWLK